MKVIPVVPRGYGASRGRPSLRTEVTVMPPGQLAVSVADRRDGSTDTVPPGPASNVMAAGAVMEKRAGSKTATVCVALAVLPVASVAVHVTVVLPTEYGPAGVAASVIGGVPPVVVGVPRLTCASHRPTSVATVIAGGGTMASGGA